MAKTKIDGESRSVKELLAGRKYSIDYYQREYKWQEKQVADLVHDLSSKFQENHKDGNEREAVENYGHYFLGSIIVSAKGVKKYIIDGQQRLTTLTLLLTFLYQKIKDPAQKGQVAELIFSQKYGKRSFNLDIRERERCMDALYNGEEFSDDSASESIANIIKRYANFGGLFEPELLDEGTLPYFVDWLIENVHFIEITAYSDDDAYTIFETMNDRGLSLTPAEMLKGYLLANISDTQDRNEASDIWKKGVQKLQECATDIGSKDEEADSIKSWLRSQYADSIRERKRGGRPKDFERIGTEFHRWVRDDEEKVLNLKASREFFDFIKTNFTFYTRWYEKLRRAGEERQEELECVHFNAQHHFTLQYPVLLAPLTVSDNDDDALRKLRLVADYLDILIHRRIWNSRTINYSTMQYAMFRVIKEIRGKGIGELADLLFNRLSDDPPETFDANDQNTSFGLHGTNRPQILCLLARMTDFLETRSAQQSRYSEYVKPGKNGYEIEHIWANHPENHKEEFPDSSEFHGYRNRIGGLLLVRKKDNASFGDISYTKKRDHYVRQNLLAGSLHEQAYDHNPGFKQFIQKSGLPFRAHPEFKKSDLEARQNLYRLLAEQIWSPERLLRATKS